MNTSVAYSAKVFDSPIGRICTTAAPSMTVTATCGVFVTDDYIVVSRHPTGSDFSPVLVSQMKTVLEDISDFRA